MSRYPLLFLMSLCPATMLAAVPPGVAFAQAQSAPIKKRLAPLTDRFELKKEQWTMADQAWFERDAVTGSANILEALANVATIANWIDGDPTSPTYGWQKSNKYRSGQRGPTNARLMEPVYILAWAYTLNKPWNPYYRDAILRDRLEAGLTYWLSLQGKDGGFSENGGAGAQELPPTSFGVEFLVEIHEMLDADGTVDKQLREHLFDSVKRAVVWASTDDPTRIHGYHYSNQYCGVMYAMYRLWQQTKESKWKAMFDSNLDYWLQNAQPSLFWLERDGVETFGYSHVTEWEMDRLLALSGDPRILNSFRNYFEWCGLNTVVENDGRTFIMDQAGHGRTTRNGLSGQVGYFNHIATLVPEARPWLFQYLRAPAERETRVANWLKNPIVPSPKRDGSSYASAYHPFHAVPMFFEPSGIWTQTEQEQGAAVKKLPTLASERFTRYFHVPVGDDHYLFARRPGIYTTLHWGKAGEGSRQVKEVGLVWLPGFGTLLRSCNDAPKDTYSTIMGKQNTFRKSILDFQLPDSFKAASKSGAVETNDLQFTTNFGGIGITKTYRITDDALEITTRTKEAAKEQIPLYFDADDTLTVDGKALSYKAAAPTPTTPALPIAFEGRTLRVKRVCGGKTAYATVEFGATTTGTLTRSYDLARGGVYILSVAVPANTDFLTRIKKD
ncbi:hypothetical protein EON83_29295 [bacterium]|nr:MAG: hypothetical protein EON83_29295 [bacterium]